MADKDTGHLAATKATLTPADIYNVSFAVSLTGYSRKEVDGFLERVGDSYAVLLAENRELQEEIAQLHRALEEYRARESALQEALRKAETLTDEILAQAKQEAELIIQRAALHEREARLRAYEHIDDLQRHISTLEMERDRLFRDLHTVLQTHMQLLQEWERSENFVPPEAPLGHLEPSDEDAPDDLPPLPM